MQKARATQGTRFFKLHGAGNDLLVVFSRDLPKQKKADFVRKITHRQLGVGSDQLIEVQSLRPLAIQIWNNDGTKAEMCANGSRTFLFLAAHEGWIDRKAKRVPIHISGAAYEGQRLKPGSYELCLGTPEVGGPSALSLGKHRVPFTPVVTGNPHAVVWMAGRDAWLEPPDFDYRRFGARIEKHPRFPKRVNVEFVRKVRVRGSAAEAHVEAWERGAGATLSCGSGAVAVAADLRRRWPEVGSVTVRMTDFALRIRFEGDRAFLSGPCALVAEGRAFL